MKILVIIIFTFFLISCEKNIEPLGGTVYLELNQEIYTVGETVEIYLINESRSSVYTRYPSAWGFSKYSDGKWAALDIALPQMEPIPIEHKPYKKIISRRTFQDTGLYMYQEVFYWDPKFKDEVGMLISNEFEIKIGP